MGLFSNTLLHLFSIHLFHVFFSLIPTNRKPHMLSIDMAYTATLYRLSTPYNNALCVQLYTQQRYKGHSGLRVFWLMLQHSMASYLCMFVIQLSPSYFRMCDGTSFIVISLIIFAYGVVLTFYSYYLPVIFACVAVLVSPSYRRVRGCFSLRVFSLISSRVTQNFVTRHACKIMLEDSDARRTYFIYDFK